MFLLAFIVTGVVAVPWMFLLLLPFMVILFSAMAFFVGTLLLFSKDTYQEFNSEIRCEAGISRVLVVDDDYASVLPLIYLLKTRNHIVKFVPSGKQMIQELRSAYYDLLIVDLKMPDMNGDKALRQGDEILNTKNKIPVIFYSGYVVQLDFPLLFKHFNIKDFWKKGDIDRLSSRLSHLFPIDPTSAA